jgi:hypothetical protein
MDSNMTLSLAQVQQNLRDAQRILAGKITLAETAAAPRREPEAPAPKVENHVNEALLSFRGSMRRLNEIRNLIG